ncbi:hypothetical protein OHC33_010986 [Knufia fluminis]|uniref:F-box domain-containing protein n=1 Tax=Knufia fluminis TaxID=191047 RepID=A0AAN8I143_9EURO|nr:hypothetical protein OHC33_010986 [Knufia fluminis]
MDTERCSFERGTGESSPLQATASDDSKKTLLVVDEEVEPLPVSTHKSIDDLFPGVEYETIATVQHGTTRKYIHRYGPITCPWFIMSNHPGDFSTSQRTPGATLLHAAELPLISDPYSRQLDHPRKQLKGNMNLRKGDVKGVLHVVSNLSLDIQGNPMEMVKYLDPSTIKRTNEFRSPASRRKAFTEGKIGRYPSSYLCLEFKRHVARGGEPRRDRSWELSSKFRALYGTKGQFAVEHTIHQTVLSRAQRFLAWYQASDPAGFKHFQNQSQNTVAKHGVSRHLSAQRTPRTRLLDLPSEILIRVFSFLENDLGVEEKISTKETRLHNLLDLIKSNWSLAGQPVELDLRQTWNSACGMIMACRRLYTLLLPRLFQRAILFSCSDPRHGWRAVVSRLRAAECLGRVRVLELRYCITHIRRMADLVPPNPEHEYVREVKLLRNVIVHPMSSEPDSWFQIHSRMLAPLGYLRHVTLPVKLLEVVDQTTLQQLTSVRITVSPGDTCPLPALPSVKKLDLEVRGRARQILLDFDDLPRLEQLSIDARHCRTACVDTNEIRGNPTRSLTQIYLRNFKCASVLPLVARVVRWIRISDCLLGENDVECLVGMPRLRRVELWRSPLQPAQRQVLEAHSILVTDRVSAFCSEGV